VPLRQPAVLAALVLVALPFSPLAAGAPPGDAEARAETAAVASKGEAELAKLLEGRVEGKPTTCINGMANQRMRTIDGTAYVYGSGRTIWVQRTRDPEQINDRDALVVVRFGSNQICRFDQMTTVDRVNGFFTGVVFFEDFVPYTRMPSPAAAEG
jgi:hypothetical protein